MLTLTRASGHAERLAAVAMVGTIDHDRPVTVGADKGGACPRAGQRPDPGDTAYFVAEMRELAATPHVAQNNTGRRSAIDRRTTQHPGYVVCQCCRKRIEEMFAWTKTTAGLRKTRHRGLERFRWALTFAVAACNLIRLSKLCNSHRGCIIHIEVRYSRQYSASFHPALWRSACRSRKKGRRVRLLQ